MKANILKFVINLFLLSLLVSCQNDDESVSNNPTNGLTTAVFNSNVTYGSMTDQEGNVYKTVKIGSQTWMAENLRTTKYNDGSDIFQAYSDSDFVHTTGFDSPLGVTGGCCTYNFTTDLVKISTFGLLYDYYAIISGKLTPAGWRVPTKSDYEILIEALGGDALAGHKLREVGNEHWSESQNTQATNESGFTLLPAGYYHQSLDGFTRNGSQAMLWAPFASPSDYYGRILLVSVFPYIEFQEQDLSPNELCSVRLIKI